MPQFQCAASTKREGERSSAFAKQRASRLAPVLAVIALPFITLPSHAQETGRCSQLSLVEQNAIPVPAASALPVILSAETVKTAEVRRSQSSQCLVNWSAVANQNRTVIDVRSASLFAQVNVVGSMNVPANAVKHRDFLKAQSLLLIGDGKSDPQIAGLCEELRDAGFVDVLALRGGLRTLRAFGYPLIGAPQAIQQLDLMSHKEVRVVAGHQGWKLLVSSQEQQKVDALGIAPDHVFALQTSAKQLAMVMTELAKKDSLSDWLVIGAEDPLRRDVVGLLERDVRSRYVFLSEPIDTYGTFLKQQELMLAVAGRPIARTCNQ